MSLLSAVSGLAARSVIYSASLADVSPVDVSGADIVSRSDAAGAAHTLGTNGIIVLILIIFAVIMFLLELIRSRYVLSTTRRSIEVPDLPGNFSGTKLVVLSDLHQMRFGDYNEELAKRIKRESPDYIFFVGDMGDADKFDVDAFYDLLEALGDGIPIIIVPGADDLRLGGGVVHKNFQHEVSRAGAVMLNNACAEMLSGDDKLYIYGLCPPLDAQENVPAVKWNISDVDVDDINRLIGKCPQDAPTILLAHDPRPFAVYRDWGAKLVLSGGMHGGTVRLPAIGGLFSPDGKLRPKYTGGEYNERGGVMFVTRGLGAAGKSLRIFNSPEISVITLFKPGEVSYTAEAAANSDPTASREKRSTGDIINEQVTTLRDWFKSEGRSVRDLINERGEQLRDFFDLLFGKKHSRFSIEADQRKRRNTYVAPKDYKKNKRLQEKKAKQDDEYYE